jgi:hypothetical protein
MVKYGINVWYLFIRSIFGNSRLILATHQNYINDGKILYKRMVFISPLDFRQYALDFGDTPEFYFQEINNLK